VKALEMSMDRASAMDYRRLADCIAAGRKDEVVIDFGRLLAAHYGKLVEHVSEKDGNPISAHNHKTLFLEGADIWARKCFGAGQRSGGRGPETEDPKDIGEYSLRPWYEALNLKYPSKYRMRDMGPMPRYVGSPEDATCMMLSLCASVDITPINLRWGIENGKPARVWGRVKADGNWYDTDINDGTGLSMNGAAQHGLVLGEHYEFQEYDEAEVPL
jgi:hypothetical protein